MGILNKLFGTPEERAQKEAQRAAEREQERLAWQAQEAAKAEADQQRQLEAAREHVRRQEAYVRSCLGDELYAMEVNTAADAKLAIKLARLRKKELAAEKRDLAAELREEQDRWRDRQAGRISTVGLGRGVGGRIARGAIQGQRRSERQDHANTVNEYSAAKMEIDKRVAVVDRFIVDMERKVALG